MVYLGLFFWVRTLGGGILANAIRVDRLSLWLVQWVLYTPAAEDLPLVAFPSGDTDRGRSWPCFRIVG